MKIQDFDEWLEDLIYPREVDDFIEVLYDGGEGTPEGFQYTKKIAFYTDRHKYYITAIEEEDDGKYVGTAGYLSCQVETRKPRAGEDWHRGNDLADGPFTCQTLEQIKNSIIAYELEVLSVRIPQRIPEV